MPSMITRLASTLLLLFAALLANAQTTPGTGTDTPVPLDRIVAVVNNDVILKSELDDFLRSVKARLRSQHTTLPPESVLEKQALDRLVMDRLQLQMAEQTGIRVDDETLNRAIQDIAQRNQLSMEQFRETLASEGYSFAKFRENIRDQIMITRLQQRNVDNHVQVSEQEVDNFLSNPQNRADDRLYEIQHILVSVPDAASPEQIQAARLKADSILTKLRGGADFGETAVSMSDGQRALQGGMLGWFPAGQVPTLFLPSIQKMKPGDISDIIRSPSGFHILKLVAVKGAQKHVIEQTHARHILIRTNEVVSDNDARSRLEQLRQRILGGDSFAELARSHSDDTASARKGGDLGWVNPGETVPEFQREMDKLAPGQISEPFKTPFGWHIVQVIARRQYDDTQQYKRTKAREAIRARKQREALELWLRRLRDEAYIEYRLKS